MLLPSLFWPRCVPWCVTTCTELLWTITTELATPRCDFLLYCIKGSLWFSIYSATYLSLRYLHRQIFNVLFCPQNLSTVSSDDVICISSFLFRIFLRILGKSTQKLTYVPEVREKFAFLLLRKKTVGDSRSAIWGFFSASSSVDVLNKLKFIHCLDSLTNYSRCMSNLIFLSSV